MTRPSREERVAALRVVPLHFEPDHETIAAAYAAGGTEQARAAARALAFEHVRGRATTAAEARVLRIWVNLIADEVAPWEPIYG